MNTQIRIQPISTLKQTTTAQLQPLPLVPAGAEVILGASADPTQLVVPIAPTAATLFGPRGVCLLDENGSLWVADTEHHRGLIWRQRPEASNIPADLVVRQAEMRCNYYPNASSLNMPYGVSVVGDRFIAADTANSRLLGWKYPGDLKLLKSGISQAGSAAQRDAQSKSENRCYGIATRDSLCWCYSIQVCGDTVAIADSGNNCVLLWRWQ